MWNLHIISIIYITFFLLFIFFNIQGDSMSNFNYMDNVPVKIAESYKPLPKVFQIPQAIAHKLQLSPQHYFESPHYDYDFQLEKKVLAKIPEYRRMRQNERDVRRERKEKREQQRMRALEQEHKQMLGAVSYPDAEDLSDSSESSADKYDDNKIGSEKSQLTRVAVVSAIVASNGPRLAMTEAGSFHNILQPTILPQSSNVSAVTVNNGNKVNTSTHHSRTKSSSSFNYKDFEEDTSSPFDNIELKTINDLDILAQVLQNTQMKSAQEDNEEQQNFENTAEQSITNEENNAEAEPKENTTGDNNEPIENVKSLQNAKAALEDIDFNITTTHIPINNLDTNEQSYTASTAVLGNNFVYAHQTGENFMSHSNHQAQQASYMHFNQPHTQQQYNIFYNQHHLSFGTNHNYLYNTPTCNGLGGTYYNSPSHDSQATTNHYIGHNANTYLTPPTIGNSAATADYSSPQTLSANTNAILESDIKCKSKSVPDILKELTDELRNSEVKRSRNYSCNQQDDDLKEIKTGNAINL